jgi:aspartyl-tRNA synthetase
VTQKFPRIAYADAMLKYGTDKPDLRNPIKIADVTEHFEAEGVTFNAFAGMIIAQGAVVGHPAPGGGLPAALVLRQAQ